MIEGIIRAIYSPSLLCETHGSQFTVGQVPIADIQIDPNNRDDIPAVLMGYLHYGATSMSGLGSLRS